MHSEERIYNRNKAMEIGLILLLTVCLAVILILFGKIAAIHKALKEMNRDFARQLSEDTNVGIDISTGDRHVRRLAAEMNRQLKLLRQERLKYRRGDQELKTAITNISHDLRTPLTAISGYLELTEQEDITEQAGRYLKIISGRVAVMRELTEELFRYSVILSEDIYGNPERISLQAAVEECMAGYYGAFVQAGITPDICLSERTVYATVNRRGLLRILSNIAGNAIKYSDGDFRLTLRENGEICCSNRASGLDKVKVEHLFDRFYTVENASCSTGLGLAIARTLTEQMQGTIGAEYIDGSLHITLRFPIE